MTRFLIAAVLIAYAPVTAYQASGDEGFAMIVGYLGVIALGIGGLLGLGAGD